MSGLQTFSAVMAILCFLSLAVFMVYTGLRDTRKGDHPILDFLFHEWGPGAVILLCLNLIPLSVWFCGGEVTSTASVGDVKVGPMSGGSTVMLFMGLIMLPLTLIVWVRGIRELSSRLRKRRQMKRT